MLTVRTNNSSSRENRVEFEHLGLLKTRRYLIHVVGLYMAEERAKLVVRNVSRSGYPLLLRRRCVLVHAFHCIAGARQRSKKSELWYMY